MQINFDPIRIAGQIYELFRFIMPDDGVTGGSAFDEL